MPAKRSRKGKALPTGRARIAKIEAMAHDLILMGETLRPSLFKLPSPDFHRILARDALDFSTKLVTTQAPRDSAKSTIYAQLLPVYHILLEDRRLRRKRRPKFIVILSKSRSEATRRIRAIKNTLRAPTTRHYFGDWSKATAVKWTDEEVILKDGTVILSLGLGGAGRGLNEDGTRPTLVVADDLEDENNTKTIAALENNIEIILAGYMEALETDYTRKTCGGRIRIIGTPISQKCMVRSLEEMARDMPSWRSRRFRRLNKNRRTGELFSLWPEKWTVDELLESKKALEKAGRVYLWYKEGQCEIKGRSDQPFLAENERRWRGHCYLDKSDNAYLHIDAAYASGQWHECDVKLACNLFMGVDPASSTSDRADHTAIIIRARAVIPPTTPGLPAPLKNLTGDTASFVVDLWRRRAQPMAVADAIMRKYKQWKPRFVAIEATSYQEMMRKYVQQRQMEEGLWMPGIEQKFTPNQAKEKRYLMEMEPDWQTGRIFVHEDASELTDEALLFDAKQKTNDDDCLDAYWYSQRVDYMPAHAPALYDQIQNPPKKEPWDKDPDEYDWKISL